MVKHIWVSESPLTGFVLHLLLSFRLDGLHRWSTKSNGDMTLVYEVAWRLVYENISAREPNARVSNFGISDCTNIF